MVDLLLQSESISVMQLAPDLYLKKENKINLYKLLQNTI